MTRRKGSGGSKLSRTEVTTVRFDPRLKLALELAARKERRTVSSFIEWAVERATKIVKIKDDVDIEKGDEKPWTAYETAYRVWHSEEADTFCAMANDLPNLLNHEELVRWELIRENDYFWSEQMVRGKLTIVRGSNSLIIDRVREQWDALGKIIEGKEIPIPHTTPQYSSKEE